MFIAQVDESDAFDKNGQQKEDVNSLFQYVENVFHIKHKPLKDTDDDNARYFHIVEDKEHYFNHFVVRNDLYSSVPATFPLFIEKKLASVSLDIQGPPPKS
jgi:hypothetical protein